MKRKAVAAFALLGIYQLIPAELVGATPRTMDCKVESVFRGHPTIAQMRDGEARLDCAADGKQRFYFSADDRSQMEIVHALREGDTYRLKISGSRVQGLEVIHETKRHFPVITKRQMTTPDASGAHFTVTYPCASFERAGKEFPANGEARYPAGCNVVAELEKDEAGERAVQLALVAKNEKARLEAEQAARMASLEARHIRTLRPNTEFAELVHGVKVYRPTRQKKTTTIKSNWMGFIITYN